ncbi:MAG: extracellular solute-binding protein [Candidatus Hodarchaeota archaeon]
MERRTRILSCMLLLAAVMVIPLSTTDVAMADQPVTITFWWTEGTIEGALYEELIADFEAQHPNIDVVDVQKGYFDQPAEWEDAVLAGEEPDVMRADVTWITSWAYQGALEPLDDYEWTDRNDFTDESMEKCMWGEKIYGIPQVVDALGMWYNKHVFEAAGVTAKEEGFTWDEFIEAGRKLNAWTPDYPVDAIEFYPFNLQGFTYAFLPIMYGFGAHYFKENWIVLENIDINTPEMIQAMEFLKSILPSGSNAMTPPVDEQGWGNINPYFDQGKVAMMFMGPWGIAGSFSAGAMFVPSAYEALYGGTAPDWVSEDNLGFMRVPTDGKPGHQGIHSGGHAYVVSSGSENKDEAFLLADFLSNPESCYKRAKVNRLVSPRKSTFTSDFDLTDDFVPADDPVLSGFRLNLETGITRPVHPYWIPLDNLFAPELEQFRLLEYATAQQTIDVIETRWKNFFQLNPRIGPPVTTTPVTTVITTAITTVVNELLLVVPVGLGLSVVSVLIAIHRKHTKQK